MKEIFTKIKNQFNSNYLIVDNPDHPYTVFSPDVLIGYAGNLLGLFFLRKDELLFIDKLLTRLSHSRLVYPTNLKCILMVNDDLLEKNLSRYLERNFHKVVSFKDINKISKIFKDLKILKNLDLIPEKIKEIAYQRYEVYYSESLKLLRDEKKKHKNINKFQKEIKKMDSDIPLNSWYQERENTKKSYGNIFRVNEGTVVSPLETHKTRSFVKDLSNLMIYSTTLDYQIDSGIPYEREQFIKYLNLESFTLNNFDPYKIIRASCFSGWIVLSTNNSDYLLQNVHNYKELYYERIQKKNKYNQSDSSW
jgi:hypothetical protein